MTKEKKALDALGDIEFPCRYDNDKIRNIIGTIEDALLKEIPQEGIRLKPPSSGYGCPACLSVVGIKQSYCHECGQSLAWNNIKNV